MPLDSKYFDILRIRPQKKAAGAAEPRGQECQWEGCPRPGTHKAPAGRSHEGRYLYFCLEHVREYNKNFNYFSGLNDEQIAKFQKDALTGHLPTWQASTGSTGGKARAAADFSRLRSGSAGALHRMGTDFSAAARAAQAPLPKRGRRLKTLEAKAFGTLGLEENADKIAIKARYKILVKTHHPDANGGDRGSEDRLREVLQAYKLLKSAGFC